MSEACLKKTDFNSPIDHQSPRKSPYVVTAAQAMENYQANEVRTWSKGSADPDDPTGKYAFQRLRHTLFTPNIDPKFKLRRDDKFYAIGSCFARGVENALATH
jgi:hypothetical protein